MLKIVQAPSPILSTPCQKINLTGLKLEKILTEMTATLLAQKEPEGVGLAANQVGLPYRLFLARFTTKKTEPVRIFINPEIVAHSEDREPPKGKKSPLEGCLSKPQYYGPVSRWQWVEVKYQNENSEIKDEKFEGFAATVIQHEMDHLNGILFIQRILEQHGKVYKVSGNDKSGKAEWDEVDLFLN